MFQGTRRWLNGPARALAAVLLLAASGGSTLAPAAAQAPVVLKMARNAEPGVFIPWLIDDNTALFTMGNVYDGLLRVTKDGAGVEPALAESWDTTPDGLTWTFHLRPGVKFSDGTPLTSNDVKVSLDLARGGTRTVWKDNYKAIKDIQTPDTNTVQINLNGPHAPLLSELAMFPAWIMQADMATASEQPGWDDANDWASKGTGGYYTESWKKGDPVILKKNPNYWKTTPQVDEVDIEYIPDDNTRVLKLQGGEDDVVDFVPFSQIDALNTVPGIHAQLFPIQQTAFVQLNVTKPPLDDLKVRQALNYATDKDAIIKSVFFGQAQPMLAPIPLGTYVDKESTGYPYDLAKAQALMAQSSVPNGFTLAMVVPNNNQDRINTAIILKDEWAKIGVNVDIQQLENSAVRAARTAGNYNSMPSAWTNDMNDPTEIVNYEMRGGPDSGSFAYWTRYNNPALNDKITAADLQQDPAQREAQYVDIQRTFLNDAPLVFIANLGATAAWNTNTVSGFLIDGLSYYRFEDVTVTR